MEQSNRFTGDSLKIERIENGFLVEGPDVGTRSRTRRRVCIDLRDLLETVEITFPHQGEQEPKIADDVDRLRELLASTTAQLQRTQAERDALRAEVERAHQDVSDLKSLLDRKARVAEDLRVEISARDKTIARLSTSEYWLVVDEDDRFLDDDREWSSRDDAQFYSNLAEASSDARLMGGDVRVVRVLEYHEPVVVAGRKAKTPLDGVETDRERIEVRVKSVLDTHYVLTRGLDDEIEGRYMTVADARDRADRSYVGYASIHLANDYDRGVRRPVAWRSETGAWHPADAGLVKARHALREPGCTCVQHEVAGVHAHDCPLGPVVP